MSVSDGYKQRLQDWINAEITRLGGQQSLSRHTAVFLSKYGLKGFATTMIGRWARGEVKEELADSTLQRIGLLRGAKSPEQAQFEAYQWLHGIEGAPTPQGSQDTNVVVTEPSGRVDGLLKAAEELRLSNEELRQLAVGAIDLIVSKSSSASDSSDASTDIPMKPESTPLSVFIKGYLQMNGLTLQEFAAQSLLSVERLEIIIEGSQISIDEAESLTPLLKLDVATLLRWGVIQAAA